MNKLHILLVIPCVVSLMFLSGCTKTYNVKGEIFIVTKAKDNVSLGLVQIALFDAELISKHIQKYKTDVSLEVDKLKLPIEAAETKLKQMSKFNELEKQLQVMINPEKAPDDTEPYLKALRVYKLLVEKRDTLVSAPRFFEYLPTSIEISQSGSDGRFSFNKLNDKKYALVTKSQRTVAFDEEDYYWVVVIDPSALDGKDVILSNNNQFKKISDAGLFTAFP